MTDAAHLWRVASAIVDRLLVATGSGRTGPWLPDRFPSVWVHACSVGEVKSALVVLRALRVPGVATSTTPSGLARLRREAPNIPSFLAPWDHPARVASFLRAQNVRRLLLLEAETWPGWIQACAAANVPVGLAALRMEPRSAVRWRKIIAVMPQLQTGLARVWTARAHDLDAARAAGFGQAEPGSGLKWAGVPRVEPAVVEFAHAALVSVHRSDFPSWTSMPDRLSRAWRVFPRKVADAPWWRRRLTQEGFTIATDPRRIGPGCAWVAQSLGLVNGLVPGCALAVVGGGARGRSHDLREPWQLGVPEVFGTSSSGTLRRWSPPTSADLEAECRNMDLVIRWLEEGL